MKRIFTSILACAVAVMTLQAAAPSGYYSKAEGKKGSALHSQLNSIIASHTNIGYDGLWSAYQTTDVENGILLDMYSTVKWNASSFKQCGNYSQVGDCVNREHSLPKSWWGGTKNNCYSDVFHLYPTDGYVNNQRSNYAFGECGGGTVLSSSKGKGRGGLGNSNRSGYTGKVWEPDDEFKGDFARTYFYMVTAYPTVGFSSGNGSAMFNSTSYPFFTDWALEMLLEWHRKDPVSEKEIKRNDAAYAVQKNRNPYIDYPDLVEYVWGNQKNSSTGWSASGTSTVPVLTSPTNNSNVDLGVAPINTTLTTTITVKGSNLSKALTVSKSGSSNFTLSATSVTAANANSGTTLTVTFKSATAGTSTGTITISSSEVSATVTVTAQAVDGIPALAATNVTENSFVANWTNVSGSGVNYNLYVTDQSDGLLSGYPKSVSSSTGKYTVTGLDAATTYKYYLTYSTIKSNTVTVTTLEPTPIIDVSAVSQSTFDMSCAPGEVSPVVEGKVYTENVTEEITLEVTGNFEISLNKSKWAQELTIDAEGETFYLRIKDTSAGGTFSGLLSASTYTLDGSEVAFSAVIAEAKSFIEDWEGLTTSYGNYNNKEVEGNMCKWYFNNAGIWGDTKKNGELSCRFGKNTDSEIYMMEDKANGAGSVSFYAATFGSDKDATITVSLSTDGGTTWKPIATGVTVTSTWQQFTYSDLKTEGNVRLKITQTGGTRLNIDDITITDYKASTVVDNVVANRGWDAIASGNHLILESGEELTFEVYDLEARLVARVKVNGRATLPLASGIYVVTAGNDAKKVIVK